MEFALVALPFLLLLLFVVQIGVYFMTKSALDSGMVKAGEYQSQQFNTGFTPVNLDNCSLRDYIVSNSGGFISSAPLLTDARPLASLDASPVPISTSCSGSTNFSLGSVIVLRAQYSFSTFMPGFGPTLTLYASTIVRRHGQ